MSSKAERENKLPAAPFSIKWCDLTDPPLSFKGTPLWYKGKIKKLLSKVENERRSRKIIGYSKERPKEIP